MSVSYNLTEYYEKDFSIMNDSTLSNMNFVSEIGMGTFGKVNIIFNRVTSRKKTHLLKSEDSNLAFFWAKFKAISLLKKS